MLSVARQWQGYWYIHVSTCIYMYVFHMCKCVIQNHASSIQLPLSGSYRLVVHYMMRIPLHGGRERWQSWSGAYTHQQIYGPAWGNALSLYIQRHTLTNYTSNTATYMYYSIIDEPTADL